METELAEIIPDQRAHRDAAMRLAEELAGIDPWRRLGITARTLEDRLLNCQGAAKGRFILQNGAICGAILIQPSWLRGPYIELFALSSRCQGRGIGGRAMALLLAEAGNGRMPNIWLCVSAFNTRARRFYAGHGFVEVATLEDLLIAGEDEILMRRRFPLEEG